MSRLLRKFHPPQEVLEAGDRSGGLAVQAITAVHRNLAEG